MKSSFTVERLAQILSTLADSHKLYIAFSGGLDSHVLLHALVQLRKSQPQLQLTAVHVNHQLSSNADFWEQHCHKICARLQVPLIVKTVNAQIKIDDHSPEEIARNLRYQALAAILPKNACLLMAHQADDQAETLLLQLFRGAGPKGLAAMPLKKTLAQGYLLRPLLQFSRAALQRYAQSKRLKWIEDESNRELKYERNFIRHKVMPQLQTHWPSIVQTLNRVATHCREADQLLTVLAATDLTQVSGTTIGTLAIDKLQHLELARQRNVLRYWLHQQHLATPSSAKVEQILQTMLTLREDAQPVVTWHGGEVRRFNGELYAMVPLGDFDAQLVIPWDLKEPLQLPYALGSLHAELPPTKLRLDYTKFTVRFRHGGEVCKLKGRRGTHTLKKLFQEWQIPPWQRERIPLLFYQDELVAIANYAVAPGYFPIKLQTVEERT